MVKQKQPPLQLTTGDIELVERLQKGDTEAFDSLYEKYSGILYVFGLKYLRSASDSEDLVQSIFLKIWGNHKNLKKEASFKSYLFTIAYHEICNLFRERNYHRRFVDDAVSKYVHSSSDTEDSVEAQSTLEHVQQIVNKLPERQKLIYMKSRNEGKSTKEIAEEFELSPGTVDNYISDSLKIIRNRLKETI